MWNEPELIIAGRDRTHGFGIDGLDSLSEGEGRRIVLNLGELDHVGSATMGLLIVTTKRVRRKGGSIAISAPTRQMRRLFEVFPPGDAPVFATDEEARAWLLGEADGGCPAHQVRA